MELTTPVCLIIFNRPDTTQLVFQKIAEAKPKHLYIIADGPRTHRPQDPELCKAARAVVSKVDWECEVKTNFSDFNMGCKKRVSSGLNWLFGQVEQAIILEDDTLPDLTFFTYCSELLEKYRSDKRIMHIASNYFQPTSEEQRGDSYYFSRYPHSWGWATWRRAWAKYDEDMSRWPAFKKSGGLEKYLEDKNATRYWKKNIDATYKEKINSWATRWVLSCWTENALSVVPYCNLVSHIGSGPNATHVKTFDSVTTDLPIKRMKFPLKHPSQISRNIQGDLFVDRKVFRIKGILGRVVMKISQLAGRPV